jgi:hypothetical protein
MALTCRVKTLTTKVAHRAADPVLEEHLSIGSITFATTSDDGRYGVRNHVLVLGLNGLVALGCAHRRRFGYGAVCVSHGRG